MATIRFSYYNLGKPDDAMINFEKAEKTDPPAPCSLICIQVWQRLMAQKTIRKKHWNILKKPLQSGYFNLKELDTAKEFIPLQNDSRFKELRNKVYNTLYPCQNNSHAREFDFWAGEWDVYVTGTKNYAGHSLVQIISGGCAFLKTGIARTVPVKASILLIPIPINGNNHGQVLMQTVCRNL